MNISQISFGAKIPIATCQVYNKKTKEPSKATIYQIDGKDEADIFYFKKLPGRWQFSKELKEDIETIYYHPNSFANYRFYSMENEDNKPIGVIEYEITKNSTNVNFLETHSRNIYKYIGTCLLGFAAKETMENGVSTLKICDPIKKALGFYINHCGFKDVAEESELEMDESGMKNLIRHSEEKTKGKIVDINI